MFTKALSSAVDENKGCVVLAQKQTLLTDTIGRKPVTEMERSGIEVLLVFADNVGKITKG